MKEVVLTKGYIALVDDQDYDYLKNYSWWVSRKKDGQIYAQTTFITGSRVDNSRKQRNVYMHRLILNIEKSNIFVDHKDGNTLNNQRSNLRFSTGSQNSVNSIKRSKNPMRGVRQVGSRFYARAKVNNKEISLGGFSTLEDAKQAYESFMKEKFGDFYA